MLNILGIHRHKWEVVSNHEFKNELINFKGVHMDGFTARDLAKRGIITVVKCTHPNCGTVKHIKTEF